VMSSIRSRCVPGRRVGNCFASLDGVRLTEFTELLTTEFGAATADSMLIDHALIEFGGKTAAQVLESGVDPRDVWVALCRDFDVPRNRW
jgi:hypothetical protein